MQAVVCHKSGSPDVLRLEDVETPAIPDDGLLVRVHASSVNPADFYALSGAAHVARVLAGRLTPKPEILGRDFAGTVAAVGARVTQFQPGEAVFGASRGAFAEYVSVREAGAVARKPAAATFEQAAAVPVAATTALQALRDHGRVRPGQAVLINGASGGVGTFAVQLATAFGAAVTGVCSARNVDLVRSLGADHVIDYAREDFTLGGRRYDLLLDIAGNRSWADYRRALAPRATLVAVGGAAHTVFGAGRTLRHVAGVRLAAAGSGRRVALFVARPSKADLDALRELLDAGKLTPVIDRRYALGEVPAAFRYLGEGHARGKLVIAVGGRTV